MHERHNVIIAGMGLAALTTAARLTELGVKDIMTLMHLPYPPYYASCIADNCMSKAHSQE